VAERELEEKLRSENDPCYCRYCLGVSGFGEIRLVYDFDFLDAALRKDVSSTDTLLRQRSHRLARVTDFQDGANIGGNKPRFALDHDGSNRSAVELELC
jgi:hypothetical protein